MGMGEIEKPRREKAQVHLSGALEKGQQDVTDRMFRQPQVPVAVVRWHTFINLY